MFATPVSIAAHPKINEWLTLVEKEMRVTLAKQLASAVQDVAAFKAGEIDRTKYMEWADKYQVSEEGLIVLVLLLGTVLVRLQFDAHVTSTFQNMLL